MSSFQNTTTASLPLSLRDRHQEVAQAKSRVRSILEEKTKVQLSYSPLTPPQVPVFDSQELGEHLEGADLGLGFGSFLRLLTWGGWMGFLGLIRRRGRPCKEVAQPQSQDH